MNRKIRNSNLMKNPYTLIIGDNEKNNNLISYHKYGSKETISIKLNEFIKKIKEEIINR